MSISDLRLQIADLKSDGRLSLPVCDEPSAAPSNGDANRRDFLKAAGFAVTGAILSGCGRAPVEEAVAPINAAEKVAAGPAPVFASTCGACTAECGMLVKSRDGRPIKLEGDPEHALSKGGLCAAGQASLLGLYDRKRLLHPLLDGRQTTWAEIDR